MAAGAAVLLLLVLPVLIQVDAQCNQTLGFEDGNITDAQLSATSSYREYTADQARLNVGNGWSASSSSSNYLQVDLLTQHRVTRYSVQGGSSGRYSRTIALYYSNDLLVWDRYITADGVNILQANDDRNTVRTFDLNPPVEARYMVFQPISTSGYGTLRLELYGCQVEQPVPVRQTLVDTDIEDTQEWLPSLSPYVINSKITVRPSGNVKVQPGVRVVFNTSEAGLQVLGQFQTDGLTGFPVVFSSSKPGTYSNVWAGLTVAQQGNLTLIGCVIREADTAVQGPLSSITLRGCHIYRNKIAFDLSSGDTDPSRIQIQDTRITDNDNGVFARVWESGFRYISVKDSVFTSNSRYDLYFERQPVLTVENSIFSSSLYGIYVYYYAAVLDLRNCTFTDNTRSGIYIYGYYSSDFNISIDRCSFSRSRYQAIYFEVRSPDAPSVNITNSNFTDTARESIYLYFRYLQEQIDIRIKNNSFSSKESTSYYALNLRQDMLEADINLEIDTNSFTTRQAITLQDSSHVIANITDNTFTEISGTTAVNIQGGITTVSDNVFLNCTAPSITTVVNNTIINRNVFMNPQAEFDVVVNTGFEDGLRLNAKNNFWDGTDKFYVRTRICDFFCDVSKLMADVEPFYLTESLSEISTDTGSDLFSFQDGDTVGGILTDSQTIGPNQHLYVSRSIYVPESMLLTVQQNVTLEFPYKQGIYTRGLLSVIGQENGNVTFTSRRSDRISWGGLLFNSTGSWMKHAFLNNSENAVFIFTNDSGTIHIEDSAVMRSTNGITGLIWGNVSVSMNRVNVDRTSRPVRFTKMDRDKFSLDIFNSHILGECWIQSNVHGLVNVSIRNSTFGNSKGFQMNTCYNNVNLDIRNSSFSSTSNSYYAIDVQGGLLNVSLRNVTVSGTYSTTRFYTCSRDATGTGLIDIQDSSFQTTRYSDAVYIATQSSTNNPVHSVRIKKSSFSARSNFYGLALFIYRYNRPWDLHVTDSIFNGPGYGMKLYGSFSNISIVGNQFNVSDVTYTSDIFSSYSCFTSYINNLVHGGTVILSSRKTTDMFDVQGNVFNGSSLILKNTDVVIHENQFYQGDDYDLKLEIDGAADKQINCTYNFWNTTDLKLINSRLYDSSFDDILPNIVFVPFYGNSDMTDPQSPTEEFVSSDGSIGGSVGGNVTLTASGSPYTVSDNIVVGKLESLTIEAGVTMLFPKGVGIIVEGALKVQGTRTDPVEGRPLVETEKWAGVKLKGSLYRQSGVSDTIRLVNGQNEREGRVEVMMNGTWGTICDDGFNGVDANVICKMLGYDRYGDNVVYYRAEFGQGTGPIHLGYLGCSGNEDTLAECTYSNFNCGHDEDAGVRCNGDKLMLPDEVGNLVELYSFYLNDTEDGLEVAGNVTVMEDVVSNYSSNYGVVVRIGPKSNPAYNIAGLAAAHSGKSGIAVFWEDDLVNYEKSLNLSLSDCVLSDNNIHGLFVQHQCNISLIQCALERNKQKAIYLESVAGINVSKSMFTRNGRGIFDSTFNRGDRDIVIVIEDSQIQDHDMSYYRSWNTWYFRNSVIEYRPRYNFRSIFKFSRNSVRRNFGHMMDIDLYSGNKRHVIIVENNSFIDNNATISSLGVPTYSSEISFQVINNRFQNNTSPNLNQALFKVWYRENTNATHVNVSANIFEKNIATQIIDLLDVRKLEENTTITGNTFKDNICSETIKTTVFDFHIRDNIFSNPLARCELEAPVFERWYDIDARWNYWGRSNIEDVHTRVCSFDLDMRRSFVRYLPYYRAEDLLMVSSERHGDFWIPNLYGGVVDSRVHLDRAGSPFVISRSIFIRSNGTLEIDSGVEVMFQNNTGVYVDGLLLAGDSSSRVTMTRASSFPWYGITFPFKPAGVSQTVRLVNGTKANEGRVEVFVNGSWSTLCSLDQHAAVLVCRALGYGSTGARVEYRKFGAGTGPILYNLGCERTMTSLPQCKMTFENNRYCNHNNDYGVICSMFVAHNGTQKYSSMTGVTMQDSREGLLVQTPTVKLSDCLIKNTTKSGMTLDSDDLDLDLNGTVIEDGQSDGILLKVSRHVRIHNGTSRNNRENGITVEVGVNKVTIENMKIKNNTNIGVEQKEWASNYEKSIIVRDNVLEDHLRNGPALEIGVRFRSYANETIVVENNRFVNNLAGSIQMPITAYYYYYYNYNHLRKLIIQRNSFISSGSISIFVPATVWTNIENNIADNSTGGDDCFFKLDVQNIYGSRTDHNVTVSTNTFRKTHGKCVVYLTSNEQGFNGSFNYNQIFSSTTKTGVILLDTTNFTFYYNIMDNPEADYELKVEKTENYVIKAEQNWWGTADPVTAGTRILHHEQDIRLMTVDYIPILTDQEFDCSGVKNCSSQGECVRPNRCRCDSGWAGDDCSDYDCSGVSNCNGYGECVGPNRCFCYAGWEGPSCVTATCEEVGNCGGDERGYCVLPNRCACFPQYTGIDCSQCAAQRWGPSCLPCPRCVNGKCNSMNGKCECTSDHWTGELCDRCSITYYGPYCLPYINVLSVIPSSGPDTGGREVHIRGHNFPETADNTFYCRFDQTVVNGTRVTKEHVICETPQHQTGGVTVEISPDNVQFTRNQTRFTYYAVCPPSACGRTETPPHGLCLYGGCVCVLPWTGEDCDIEILAPVISPFTNNMDVAEGDEFLLQVYLIQGSEPVEWSLSGAPAGLGIDSRSGRIYWERAVASVDPYTITVTASNRVASTEETFAFTVALSYRVIIDELSPTGLFPAPTSVQVRGHVEYFSASTSSLIAFVDVKIRNKGQITTLSALTAPNSPRIEAVYFPKVGESGVFEVDGRHPSDSGFEPQTSWRVLGMRCEPGYTNREAYMDTDTVELREVTLLLNDGADAIRNISAFVEGTGGPLTSARVRVSGRSTTPESGPLIQELGPGAEVPVDVILTASRPLSGTLGLLFNTTEGTVARMRLYVRLRIRRPVLTTSVSELRDSVPRGSQKTFQVNVTNGGEVPATSLRVTLPSEPRLAVSAFSTSRAPASEDGLDLEPGESAILVLTVTVDSGESLGEFSGSIALNSDLASASISYRFYVTSLTKLNVTVRVEDEYTYFASDKPLVSGATVNLKNNLRGYNEQRITTNETEFLVFENVHEDRYTLQASAPGHSSYSAVIIAKPSESSFTVFLQRVAVTYTWTVTPTTIEDKYIVTLDSTFETNVPMPVVTVDPANINLIPYEEGKKDVINFNITNHGLIRADNARFAFPTDHPTLIFTQTIDPIGAVEANTSIIVPVQVKLRSRSKRNVAQALLNIACGLKFLYDYFCGENRIGGQDITLGRQYPGRPPLPCGGGSGDVISRPRGPVYGVDGVDAVLSDPSTSVVVYNPVTPLTCDCALSLIKDCLIPLHPLGGAFSAASSTLDLFNNDDVDYMGRAIALRDSWTSISKGKKSKSISVDSNCIKQVFGDCPDSKRRRRDARSEVVQGLRHTNLAFNNYLEMVVEVFGGEDMFDVDDDSWMSPFNLALADDSAGGGTLTQSEITAITSPLNATLVPAVRKFLIRWNNTVTAWEDGTLTTLGHDDDVIPYNVIMTRSEQFKQDTESAKQRGFVSIFEEYEHAVNVYKESEDQGKTDEGVCAKVRVRIVQELVLTRDAFNARLEIENGELSALENIEVTIKIRATYGDGTYTNDKFSIGNPTLVGITAVDGSGRLTQDMSGSAEWLIIPYSTAAVKEDTLYDVGGTLSYTVDGSEFSISLLPDTITVKPNPSLILNYFHEKYVQGDDPMTLDITEPVVPFTLAVMVSNGAYGVARQLKITSAQPEIIENEKGLLVSFKIVGAQLGNNPVTPSLTIDFGDIESFETKTARWLLTSSLQGRFYNFTATFENINPLGDPQLSIMESVGYHELVHLVRLKDNEGELDDFLVNDVIDADNMPDAVYDSSNGFYSFPVVTGTINRFSLEETDVVGTRTYKHVQLVVTISTDKSSTYFYARLENSVTTDTISDSLLEVVRDDGKKIVIEKNAWQTNYYDDTFYFHIFDYISDLNTSISVTYNLVFGPRNMYPPELSKDEYEIVITPSQTPGIVFTFEATDKDTDSILMFSLEDTSAFTINAASGELRSSENLEAGSYEFTVTVTDDGRPPLHDSATVVVIVSEDGRPPSTSTATQTPASPISFSDSRATTNNPTSSATSTTTTASLTTSSSSSTSTQSPPVSVSTSSIGSDSTTRSQFKASSQSTNTQPAMTSQSTPSSFSTVPPSFAASKSTIQSQTTAPPQPTETQPTTTSRFYPSTFPTVPPSGTASISTTQSTASPQSTETQPTTTSESSASSQPTGRPSHTAPNSTVQSNIKKILSLYKVQQTNNLRVRFPFSRASGDYKSSQSARLFYCSYQAYFWSEYSISTRRRYDCSHPLSFITP